MPLIQLMGERFNVVFSRDQLDKVRIDTLAVDRPFPEVLSELGIARTDEERQFLETWPAALQEAMRSVLLSAMRRSPRVPVAMTWAPGYDYELSVWEARSTATSPTAITVHVRSRYPDDLSRRR